MKDRLREETARLSRRLEGVRLAESRGRVVEVTGLIVESDGPSSTVGAVCGIEGVNGEVTRAEVVGFRGSRVLLMPLEPLHAVQAGSRVVLSQERPMIPAGEGLLGRVIDGLGRPLDGQGPLRCERAGGQLHNPAPNPMTRQPIAESFRTGVRAIDAFVPLGRGQRVGIFSGSGVGKSTLLGMVARGAEAEVNVIALVGERGRELREFIERDLGEEGRRRSVVVVSTSDHPAPLRLRAAYLATAIAEEFRSEGKQVLLMMDSLTRFAMAQREVGLAVGEPPTARGYTPSVFAALPRLLERAGMGERGSITALYTVLVEGDDLNEPIADATRGILDGHVVLSRSLATANHFPAIDVLESISRLQRAICQKDELEMISKARDLMALYRKNEDLILLGAYNKGANARLDEAIARRESFLQFLRQGQEEQEAREGTWSKLRDTLQ